MSRCVPPTPPIPALHSLIWRAGGCWGEAGRARRQGGSLPQRPGEPQPGPLPTDARLPARIHQGPCGQQPPELRLWRVHVNIRRGSDPSTGVLRPPIWGPPALCFWGQELRTPLDPPATCPPRCPQGPGPWNLEDGSRRCTLCPETKGHQLISQPPCHSFDWTTLGEERETGPPASHSPPWGWGGRLPAPPHSPAACSNPCLGLPPAWRMTAAPSWLLPGPSRWLPH